MEISFHTSEDRAVAIIAHFENINCLSEARYDGKEVILNFNEIYLDIVVQGVFHAGVRLGLETGLKLIK